MPRSPLTLLLIVLTLLAFAAHLVCLGVDSPLSQLLFGAGVMLVIGSTASIVRDAGSFDSRAFHRSRPHGDSRAFWNATLSLAGLVAMVVLLGFACMRILNLRSSDALRFGAEFALPVWFCAAAFATGFTLIFGGDSRRVLVTLLLILPPVLVSVFFSEWRGWRSYAFQRYLWGSLNISTWATLGGGAGYSLAWWLAARRKQRGAALMVACLTGAGLPVGEHLGVLPVWSLPPMPDRKLEITRTVPAAPDPIEEKLRKLFRADQARQGQDVPILLGGRLHVSGMREDEFVWSQGLVPWERRRGQVAPAVSVGQGWVVNGGESAMPALGADTFVIHGDPSLEMTGEQSVLDFLARQLPQPARLERQFHGPSAWSRQRKDLDWISVDEKQVSIEAVEAATWRVNGALYRMEGGGSGFDLTEGGWLRFPSGGSVVISPWPVAGHPECIFLHMFGVPRFANDPANIYNGGYLPNLPVALLRDPRTGDVRRMSVEYDSSRANSGLWQYLRIRTGREYQEQGDPKLAEELLRSRLYLFQAVPQGRVDVSLPPPK